MIKCPNCSSTAQVKIRFADDLNNIDTAPLNWVSMHLICGCGCKFRIDWIQEGVFKE